MSDRFGGLPEAALKAATIAKGYYSQYTIPKKLVGPAWDMGDEYLTFSLIEITPEQQKLAAKTANGDAARLQDDMIQLALYQVGEPGTENARTLAKDADFRKEWWNKIGMRGRMLVMTAFAEMVSVEEDDIKTFLASCKTGTV